MRIGILLVILATIGCVSAPTASLTGASTGGAHTGDPFNGLGDPMLMGSTHSHSDLAAHKLATPSMKLLGHETFAQVAGAGAPPAYAEEDLLGKDHLVIAGLLNGFYLADIKDPAKPIPISYTPDPGYVADVKASEDGNFVFVGIQAAGFTGVHIWNVQVMERPVLVGGFPIQGTAPFEGGCHMLAVHKGYLYCAPNDATIRIFQIVENGPVASLVPVAAYAPFVAPPAPVLAPDAQGDQFTHDMTVEDDPVTGDPVMLVSFWDHGVRVVDVKDPAHPTEIGGWDGTGADATWGGNIHTSEVGLVNGKRVIVTIPEYADVPSVTVLDATNYKELKPLGVWAPHTQEELNGQSRTFSTHNFQLVGSKVYLAMYHGGVWVLDLSDLSHPKPVGYYLPAEAPASVAPIGMLGGGPNTWDVIVKNGVILASDIPSGLYAIQYAGDVGATNLTSFA